MFSVIKVEGFDKRDIGIGFRFVDVGRVATVHRHADVRMPVKVVLIVHHRGKAANKQQGLAVVQQTHFVRRHELPARSLHVGGVAAAFALGLPVGTGVDGLLAQELGDVFVGTLLVAAQIQERITVAGYGLPSVLLIQSFELGQVLDDDRGADLPGAHGGQGLVKLLRQGHVGELVQHHPHMDRQPSMIHMVSLIIELLNDLGVEHTHEVGQRRVVVGDDGEDGRLYLSDVADVHIVVVGDRADLVHIERRQSDCQGDVDTLGRLASRLFVDPVLLDGDMIGLIHAHLLEQQVQSRGIGLLILPHIRVGQHLHDHSEVLLLLRCFVEKIEHHGLQQRGLGLLPKRVAARCVLRRGVADQIGDQLQHVLIVPDIAEWIVTVRLGEIDQIEGLDRVPFLQQQMTDGGQDLALRVGHYEATVALHDPRQRQGSGLASAAAAQGQNVQIPSVSMGVHADPHMPGQRKALFLRQLPVQLLGVAPFGGAVLLALAQVGSRSEIYQPAEAVECQTQQYALGRVGAPFDLPWGLYPFRQPGEHIHQASTQAGGQQQREPDRRQQEDPKEQQVLLFGIVSIACHMISGPSSPCRGGAFQSASAPPRPCRDTGRPRGEHIAGGTGR